MVLQEWEAAAQKLQALVGRHSHSWMAAHDPSSRFSRGAAIVAKKGVHSIGGEKVWVAVLHGMVVVLAAPQQLQWRWASH